MDEIRAIAELLLKSKYTVLLSGAGMSTESGIPDFRSSGGIYEKTPEEVFSIGFFRKHPDRFYNALLTNIHRRSEIKPNIGHIILAEWGNRGLVHEVITQNVDSLHTRAGSKNVIEIHGHSRTATCIRCGKNYVFDEILARGGEFYYCDCIDGKKDNLIKPDVVLFGENVPLYGDAMRAIQSADLIFVLGTSLVVYPVAGLLHYARPNANIVIINKSSTSFDGALNVRAVHKPIGETLKAIDDALTA